ncbi:Ubiquinone/menaquinone biosynthesis C-methylase UbiE [Nonomuraea solani]|uniref:Ubiquinone/menaquinone biosynthesis C-methylase UbiE n=1 Tax=Nonomuraea solani TaxID=1144553 RepID=A0A1H6EIE9_9ACTN|nr:class I SAM-dependent methyltransferase [Nonomuraea solani]SEG96981.1 Ubiquinone/menaquinone biosynthesis C-methylase UbiE [Nonomuraea solani]
MARDPEQDSMIYDDTTAAAYDRGRWLRAGDIDRWMAAARVYLPDAGGRVLDLGAGTGRFTAALARACGATVVACEPSEAMRAACRAANPGTPVVAGTAQAVPFQDAAFDALWASMVLHHVQDLPAFATSARRVLRAGGHLLVRGGFGPVEELPLYRYFPEAWAVELLPLDRITEVLAAAGIERVDHLKVEQVLAESADEFVERVRTRSLSNLAKLPEDVFQRGLRALERGGVPGRVVEELDLVVFRRQGPALR